MPEPLQQEVLDFVEYLRLKQTLPPAPPARRDAAWAKAMRQVVTEFRQSAAGYAAAEIDQIIDDAVEAVRRENRQRKPKARP